MSADVDEARAALMGHFTGVGRFATGGVHATEHAKLTNVLIAAVRAEEEHKWLALRVAPIEQELAAVREALYQALLRGDEYHAAADFEAAIQPARAFEAAIRAEGLDGPEALEKEAGRLLVAAAKARLERGGPNDAHEVRHLYAAIQYGNSDDETDGCRLDTQLVADYAVVRLAEAER